MEGDVLEGLQQLIQSEANAGRPCPEANDAIVEIERLRDRVEALVEAAFELLQEMEAIRSGAQWCDCPSFQRAQDMLYKHHNILAKP